jgi:WD40 repeat protein
MSSNQEELIFALAASKSGAARAQFLDRECGHDKALRQRLEARLAALDRPEHSPLPGGATIQRDLPEVPDAGVGMSIGRYKILERVGEGGCGVVYVAEQTEPVRRRVALKVIKLGMDTKQVVARFEAERQALAMMDHPNIAKVLDAGSTEAGRPYFVMELVRGIRITEYCDQAALTTKERLDLFIKVCQAIQHAHQKGIIHRDIKPSNILVTLHDGVPVPKVIDFGIAKATEGRLTDATVYTQLHQFIGTPAYMSPEQAEMSGLDIDTRSDIYSLGVLLYELLIGSTPFDARELISQGIDGMRKTIREKEPARPSTRFATLKGEELTTMAKRRSTDTTRLLHQLRGDLDWIVMKCLEKDRTHRYDTAIGLAYDLHRHLHHEPVLARPASAAYKLQKAFRRNKVIYAAGAAVVLALIVGLSLAAVGLQQAVTERNKALAAQADQEVQRRQAQQSQGQEAKLRAQAQSQELAARHRAYASEMNAAKQALGGDKLGRALDLLNRQKPQPGQPDLRGWEWRYLWQQTRSAALSTLCQESRGVMTVAASADGDLLALGGWRGDLTVRDLRTRQESLCLTTNQRSMSFRAAFSPVDPLLAFATINYPLAGKYQSTLHLWNTSTRQMTAEFPLDAAACQGLAFSTNGRTLLTSTSSGTEGRMTLWRVPDGTKLAGYPVQQQIMGPQAHAFAATPDLRLAAYSSSDGAIHVMDLRHGKELWMAQGTKLRITALAFSPDQKLLASAGGYEEKDIRLWDVAAGRDLGRLEGHSAFISSLLFWPDGKRLASSSIDQTIRIWDVATRACLDVLRGHREPVLQLALLADQKTLVSGCADGTVCLWDASAAHPKEPQRTLAEKVAAFCFVPDRPSLVTLEQSGEVAEWSGAEFGHREPLLNAGSNLMRGSGILWQAVFSRDGQFLAVGSTNGRVQVWNLPRRVISCQLTNKTSEFAPLAFLAGGKKLMASANDSIGEWDLATGLTIQSWQALAEAGCVSPDERWFVATGAQDERLLVIDLAGKKNAQLELGIPDLAGSTFSPDGTRLAVGSALGHVHVLDTTDQWRELALLRSDVFSVYAVAFSPDGKRLVMGGIGQRTIQLWDSESWQDVLTLQGQGASYVSAAVSPDGNTIAALDATGLLQLWHAPSWQEIAAAEAKDPPNFGGVVAPAGDESRDPLKSKSVGRDSVEP